MDRFLRDLKQLGFSGVQNFPTVGLIDGQFRESLEETGMGFDQEVEMIARAHDIGLTHLPIRVQSRRGEGHGRTPVRTF